MEESSRKSIYARPMTLAEMMPSLGGVFLNNSMHKMSVRKASRKVAEAPHTTGKDFRPSVPLTMAQLRAELEVLKPKTPSRGRVPTSAMKKKWNISTKCEKKRISNINSGTMNLAAKKILNFQPVSKPATCNIPRPNIRHTFASPKQSKPEKKANNTLKHLNGRNTRISGIFQIPETPALSNARVSAMRFKDNKENVPNITIPPGRQQTVSGAQLISCKKTMRSANRRSLAPTLYKENKETQTNLEELRVRVVNEKVVIDAQTCTQLRQQRMSLDMDESFKQLQCEKRTDASNISVCSHTNSERSFLEQENVINNETVKNGLQTVPEDSPQASTPFKNYRNVDDYFNESSDYENSDTAANVTNYDAASMLKSNGGKEEGDILYLCDLMGKAQVTHNDESIEKYHIELLKMKNELERERRFIRMSLKRNEFMLNSVNKLLSLDEMQNATKSLQKSKCALGRNYLRSCGPKMVTQCVGEAAKSATLVKRVSKSPSYKIPKRTSCLRKRALFKSMPVGLDAKSTTPKSDDAALSVYMKMKKENTFLITPMANKTLPLNKAPNTPAIMSMNLHNQLEKLYNETP